SLSVSLIKKPLRNEVESRRVTKLLVRSSVCANHTEQAENTRMPAAIHGQNRSCGSHRHFYENKQESTCLKRFRFSSKGSLQYHG
ncbi:MAG TPA: hypothetical protein DDZ24_01005, partial [Planctomycetaceae bacterium]|nr:hypothetical protein [Planctomycetaceae bacterium]